MVDTPVLVGLAPDSTASLVAVPRPTGVGTANAVPPKASTVTPTSAPPRLGSLQRSAPAAAAGSRDFLISAAFGSSSTLAASERCVVGITTPLSNTFLRRTLLGPCSLRRDPGVTGL